jgi:hypothetical protein
MESITDIAAIKKEKKSHKVHLHLDNFQMFLKSQNGKNKIIESCKKNNLN